MNSIREKGRNLSQENIKKERRRKGWRLKERRRIVEKWLERLQDNF